MQHPRPIAELHDLTLRLQRGLEVGPAIVSDISLTLAPGEVLGLVGESGSGKSTIALALMGWLGHGLTRTAGEAFFEDAAMLSLPAARLQALRGGKIALIPQNAGQALSPRIRIGAQLDEALALHSDLPRSDWQARKITLLKQVRLPEPATLLRRFPHELSGGQQQRVAIAMALAGEPRLLVLDEPTTGLDVTTQAHVLELLHGLRQERGLSMILVSHDMGVIARLCDRVAVLYAGGLAEVGTVADVLNHPAHPYSRALLQAIPRMAEKSIPLALEGRPPAPGEIGTGCRFAPRCGHATELCRTRHPLLATVSGMQDRLVACHHAEGLTGQTARPQPLVRAALPAADAAPLLQASNLEIRYGHPGLLARFRPERPATVSGVSFALRRGETLSIVGESGSGKSTILKAIAGLIAPAAGALDLGGTRLPADARNRSREMRRRVQMVFQNPDASLNPRQTVREILAQPLRLYEGLAGQALEDRILALLADVRLGPSWADKLPRQLSGGEKQRIGIARAFAAKPDLILCDEITSALDVSVQAAILALLADLQARSGTALLFVSHDLAVVRAISDRVLLLYQGRVCEAGSVDRVFGPFKHPYGQALLGAVLEPVPGRFPRLLAEDRTELTPPAQGCPFQRRCRHVMAGLCDQTTPPDRAGLADHTVLCHLPAEALTSDEGPLQ